MTYEREEYMRRQEAEHAMIRMRDPRYDVRNLVRRDTDGSRDGGDACGSVRSTTAGAEGIAKDQGQ